MTDEKPESTDWGTFFSQTKQKLAELIDKRRTDRFLRDQTPREKIVELNKSVVRSARVRNFLESDIWKDDIEPFLRAEAALPPWQHGDPLAPEEALTKYVYNSGKAALAARVVTQLRAWVQAGAEAEKVIKKDTEMKLAHQRTP